MPRWLSPGDVVCDLVGLPDDGENRMILRMFINILVLGAVFFAIARWIFA